MNLHLPLRVTIRVSEPETSAHRVVVTGFRRLCCRGSNRLMFSGLLSYLTPNGRGAAKVGMTWEAYSRLIDVMRREDLQLPDDLVVSTVLQRWGRRQVESTLRAGRCLHFDGFLLDFGTGPSSQEPRRVLQECLLLEADELVGASSRP